MYHRAWEYASVSELILIVKAVTTSIVITMVVVTIVTGNRPFLDCLKFLDDALDFNRWLKVILAYLSEIPWR